MENRYRTRKRQIEKDAKIVNGSRNDVKKQLASYFQRGFDARQRFSIYHSDFCDFLWRNGRFLPNL